ncbi:DUF2157 domain-containing protein [Roseibium denhamense]|uniref:Uncharacterized membrane protein n=1 Tax=Roseibium denhamense TaxID=76305 RepID=A0ABY1P5J6_9HYPH|nr:DUF2157 domain-containing protein [Roseibium denhamense]MTI07128.1 DUF2157 domain-containing protein [Roseibium denhamense]SMP26939.1 Uncharacterized membrane protein [Roseibium denhamense]
MFDWIYKKRLRDDLEHWVEKGWVSSANAAAILEEQEVEDGRSRLPLMLGGIGLVCVALAVFAFIAANWAAIPKPVKLTGIALLVLSAHGLAAIVARAGRKGLADLMTGFATLMFVGGMALVGQIFHLPADWSGGAFLVCIGALAAAWGTASRAPLVIAAIAAISWQVSRTDFEPSTMLEILISLGFLTAVFLHPFLYPSRITRWAAILLLLITFTRWLVETGDRFGGNDAFTLALVLGGFGGMFAVMLQAGPILDLYVKWSSERPVKSHAHWLMLRSLQDVAFLAMCVLLVLVLILLPEISDEVRLSGLAPLPSSLPLGLAALMCGTGLLLSFKTIKGIGFFAMTGLCMAAVLLPVLTTHPIPLAAAVLAALVGLCALGTWYNNRYWMVCAYLALTVVALWLLQVTIGSLLGQSIFFLIAGGVLLGVALLLARVFKRQRGGPKTGAREAAA